MGEETGLRKNGNLWFDDGYVEDFTIIRPLLRERGLVGILAIITSKVGKEGYLNIERLKIMIREGWKIASHSVTHRNFKNLSIKEVSWELRKSLEWINESLSLSPVGFVAPYGHINQTQKALALSHYPFVRAHESILNFHSKYFQSKEDALRFPGRKYSDKRAEYERVALKKVLEEKIGSEVGERMR